MISFSDSERHRNVPLSLDPHHVVRHLSKTDAVRRQGSCHLPWRGMWAQLVKKKIFTSLGLGVPNVVGFLYKKQSYYM